MAPISQTTTGTKHLSFVTQLPPPYPPAPQPAPAVAVAVKDARIYPAAPFTLEPALHQADEGLRPPLRGLAKSAGGLDLLWAFIVLIAWLFLNVIAGIAVIALGKSDNAVAFGLLFSTMLPWLALAGGPLLVAKLTGNGPIIDYGLRFRWRFVWWGLLYGVISIVVAFALATVTTKIWGTFDSNAGEQLKGAKENSVAFVGLLIAAGIGAPIVEELMFRGLIFGGFAKLRVIPIFNVLLTSAIFAAIHFEPKRFLLLAGIGIVLACARWHTGSTITSMVAHMTNNSLSVVGLITGSVLLFH